MLEATRLLHMIGSLEIGGSQAMVMNLYEKIDRRNLQFDFIIDHPDQTYLADRIKALGGKVYFMPTFKGWNVFEIQQSWNSFFEEHPEYKVLHSHVRSYASIYLPIAKKHGLKTIIHSHSTSNGKGVSSAVKALMQYPLRFQADYFMSCSDKAGRWLFGKRITQSNNYMVIPNAIDSERFVFGEKKRNQIRSELSIEDKFVVGHVGRLTEPKNHSFLLEVFAELRKTRKDAVLLLVGDGKLKKTIEEKIQSLNLDKSVLLLGSKSNTYDYYQAMDVFAFPSLWEGLGIAAIEAQASGLPCVVSERIPEEINIGAGLIHVVSLDEGKEVWAKAINSYESECRFSRVDEVKKAGYDISENAKLIQKFYLDIIAE